MLVTYRVVEPRETATAYQAWEARWSSAPGRAAWLDPEPEVMAVVQDLRGAGGRRALDLGCGVGRHSLYLAHQGWTVSCLDASASGMQYLLSAATGRGLRVVPVIGAMTDLPYDAGQFDYILAWNVIYHGNGEVVRRCLAEIWRVLRPGGLYQGTMLSKRHRNFGSGREVASNTFVQDGGEGDKAHPHFYCDRTDLASLLSAFELRSLADRNHGGPGTYHWHLVAERRC